MKMGWGLLAVALSAIACDGLKDKLSKKDDAPVASAAAEAGAAAPAAKQEENLLSIAAGAMLVEPAAALQDDNSYAQVYDAFDDDLETRWAPPKATYKLVMIVPQKTIVKKLSWKGESKKVVVEASESPNGKGAFVPIAELSGAAAKTAPQTVAVTKEVTARAYRFTFENADEDAAVFDVRGFGAKVDEAPSAAGMTGAWKPVDGNELHLKQSGSSVVGCLATNSIYATVEGDVAKGVLRYADGKTEFPILLNVAPDGSLVTVFNYTADGTTVFSHTGARIDPKTASTPCALTEEKKTAAPPPDPIAADIEKLGRARIYGIRFDTDSDVIKPESKAVLDRVAAVLKAKSDWKLTVEGHTDDTATPQYNQGLSERRANAVKKWLETQGIAGGRLQAVGLGQTKPIAPNKTSIGRAENRRVELVKR